VSLAQITTEQKHGVLQLTSILSLNAWQGRIGRSYIMLKYTKTENDPNAPYM
jgi:hypothetical protein